MPFPSELRLHKKSKQLQISFDDGTCYQLTCEYLRVFSPSAEVRGHANEPRKLIFGKKNVGIINIESVGNYAVKFIFDDGHSSGIYTWETLHHLSVNYEDNWRIYLDRLGKAKLSRD